jgi:hemoglobin
MVAAVSSADLRADIADRADCERLVRAFYGQALGDPLIGWIFTDVARLDLEAHVPVLTSFWEGVLLGGRSYRGGAFRPHAVLHAQVGLRAGHFDRWLTLWGATVDELFAGERAEQAKGHARRVAEAFEQRLGVAPPAPRNGGSPDRPPPPADLPLRGAGGLFPISRHGPREAGSG